MCRVGVCDGPETDRQLSGGKHEERTYASRVFQHPLAKIISKKSVADPAQLMTSVAQNALTEGAEQLQF